MPNANRVPAAGRPRVLCVDDEPMVLGGLATVLRQQFEVVTAVGPFQGLDALAKCGPFKVVISDFAMPEMNGAQFLARARLLAPDTIRILLTGQAGLDGAIEAVNEGGIFRFLMKPCAPDSLIQTLGDAVYQADVSVADRLLNERKLETLSGHLLRAERLATLGTMASAIGHELNNVLTVFTSALEFVKEAAAEGKPPSPPDLEALEHVRHHLVTHAQNLHRFGRPTRAIEDAAGADLCGSVGDAISMLRTAGILRNVELDLQLAFGKVPVGMARSEIEQIIVNLVKNAVDALRECARYPANICVAVERSADGKKATCTVRDNGSGISKENLPLLFEPYFTTKPFDRGSGLGLFVVRQLVQSRGGTIDVHSEEGAGSAFSFELPIAS